MQNYADWGLSFAAWGPLEQADLTMILDVGTTGGVNGNAMQAG